MSSLFRVSSTVLLIVLLGASPGAAQPTQETEFNPSSVWPAQMPQNANSARTGTGHPGVDYWQNQVSYTIDARLDTAEQKVQGVVEITYTNNSPSSLSSIWLLRSTEPSSRTEDAPIHVTDVTVHRDNKTTEPTTVPVGPRLQVRLSQPIPSGGGTTTLSLDYEVSLSAPGLPSRSDTRNGPIYSIGHWVPRVAAYSTQHGWATPPDPTHAEYGSFDYSVTVPASFILAGSGTLLNPGDVLTDDQRRRLNRARDSERKVAIITPDKAGTADTRPAQSGTLTWNFGMNGVRTVAWVASPSFIWNGARFDRKGQRDGVAMSYYTRSAMGGEAWNRSTYHTQNAVNLYSDRLHSYPWTNAVNVSAPVNATAFPGLSLCPLNATGYSLFSCSVQNQSYNWFPTIVASNPDRDTWMSDGLATFLSVLAHRQLYEGEFAPKNDRQYVPGPDSIPARAMANHMERKETTPILAPPSPETNAASTVRHTFKPAFGLHLLRDYVLTPDQFDYALRQFAQRWDFKKATPQDFFKTIEDATGTDLSWFWKGWFGTTWTIDLAVQEVAYQNDTPTDGARITFALNGPMPMPVRATVTTADGTKQNIRLPVDVWRDGPTHTLELGTSQPLQRVALDPAGKLPDTNPANNTWTADTQ